MLNKQSHFLKLALERIVHRLLKVNSVWFAIVFLIAAVLISVIIVLTIDFFWDRQFNLELQFAGIVTPFLDGLLLVVFVTAMLNVLRAEVMRRETAERILNKAQRIAKIGNWTLELATAQLTWSEEIFRIFEIDSQQFGASYSDFINAIHPEDRELVDGAYQNSLKNKVPYSISHRLLMKDGRIKYVIERAETIYGPAENPLRSIGTVQDITEQKRLEQELQIREAVFRGLFENMNSAVAIYEALNNGEDFVFRDFNHSGELIENCKREQLIGKRLTETFPKVKKFGLFGVLCRVWQTGKAERFPVTFYSDNRISGWRENFVFRLPSGELVVIYDDVTDRKLGEKAVQDSRENLQRLLDSMAEGAYGVDTMGKCTFVNRAFLNLLGYQNANEIIGHSIHKLIHHTYSDGKPYPESECKSFGAFKSSQPIKVSDEVYWHKDGTPIPVEYSSYPIVKDGEVIGAVATFSDITERKMAEEKIRNLAFYDALTQLPNRRLLDDRLGQAMATSKRSGHYGALMFLDLDNFKPINDTHGHAAGDLLLIEVADRLKRCVREMDTVGRIGGDEFVVMLIDLNTDRAAATSQAGIFAEKIRIRLAEPYTLTIKHEGKADTSVEHHCTASIGVVLFGKHEASQDDILKWADTAMYQAKDAGRNLVRFYDSKA